MGKMITCILAIISLNCSFGQPAPDFMVTDVNGINHSLYSDYLDQGKTVVLDFFFADCTICKNRADDVEAVYQNWGAGQADVEFLKITIHTTDKDSDVSNFMTTYGNSFPGISEDGGASIAGMPYTGGSYGTFWGAPTYVVIAPNGVVNFDVSSSQLSSAISATGAIGNPAPEEPTQIEILVRDNNQQLINPSGILSIHLKSSDDPSIDHLITDASFEYPSDQFPEVESPYLEFVPSDIPNYNIVTTLDLLRIQKHILGISPIQDTRIVTAADTNGNGTLSSSDISALRKVILGIYDTFPGRKAYDAYIEDCEECQGLQFPITTNPGNSISVEISIYATGNTN